MKKYKIYLSLLLPSGGECVVNNSGMLSKTQVPVLKRFLGQPFTMVQRYIKRVNGTIEEVPYIEETVIGE